MRYRLGTALVVLALAACGEDSSGPSNSLPNAGGTEGRNGAVETRSGYIFGRNGAPMMVTYEVRDGEGIFEGDILLGPVDSIPSSAEELWGQASRGPRGLNLGVVIDGSNYRWP